MGKRGRKEFERRMEKEEESSSEEPALSSDSEEDEPEEGKDSHSRDGQLKPFRNRQRVLVFGSRGMSTRHRFLMRDLQALLPHSRKEVKYNLRRGMADINELAEDAKCNNVLFLEGRRHEELYLWLAKAPYGPSVRFHVKNMHTMLELKMTGNCLRGSRPILSFDSAFESQPHWQLVKELLVHVFGTPNRHPGSKPFFDHVMAFALQDDKVWFRHYQVAVDAQTGVRSLVEIGPRFVLDPVRVLSGSFEGQTLYLNQAFDAPANVKQLRTLSLAEANRNQKETRHRRREYTEEVLPHLFTDDIRLHVN